MISEQALSVDPDRLGAAWDVMWAALVDRTRGLTTPHYPPGCWWCGGRDLVERATWGAMDPGAGWYLLGEALGQGLVERQVEDGIALYRVHPRLLVDDPARPATPSP